jgi:imidazolonepropionase-like amidohydrolase
MTPAASSRILGGMTTVTDRRRLTALRAGWLFDGTSSTLTANPTVVLDGDTILAVDAATTPPSGAEVVDLPGATLLPGLIDTHVHLAFDASTDPVGHLAARDDNAALQAMAKAARTAACGGVTTVRDLGDRNYLALALREAAPGGPLPTIVAAGPPITTPGGHCHFLGGATTGADGVRAAVRTHAERGVDVIKIMASGGALTPGTHPELPQFSTEELRAAVDEAHRHSLPITAHAHGTPAIAAAIAAGADGIEHASFTTTDAVDTAPENLIRAIVERRIVLGATGGFTPGAALPPAMAARLPVIIANFRRLHEAGAPIVVGTDAGVGPPKPPDVLRWGVSQLAQIGLSPVAALRTVTSQAAAVCRLAHRKGQLAPGFDADILAIDGNPLTDPAALHRIRAIYLRGIPIRPATTCTATRTR